MVAVLQEASAGVVADAGRPVVIVGSGPAGVRLAQELARRAPALPVVLYGDEESEPYNRVRLSAFLAGELGWESLTRDLRLPETARIERRLGCAVVSIARRSRTVFDARNRGQPYSRLVLATGSKPYVPAIPGITRSNVFTFRDVGDAQRLLARTVRSRRTVVLGGGLLGLEAARAMRRFRTEIVVVEQEAKLMPQQLDDAAAVELRARVEALGIRVVTGDGARAAVGREQVEAVQLRSGQFVECDTLIVAAGIRPRVALALRAGLPVQRGIRVDDELRTSDPDIFAIGECAEHRGTVYGLAAPGLEQAAVAAAVIAGERARYVGSIAATRLKVLDIPVFSIGRVREEDRLDLARARVHRGAGGRGYAKVVTERGRAVGALCVGEHPDLGRLHDAVVHARRVLPWQLWRFARSGSLWPPARAASVLAWPESAAVCNCTGVTRGELGRALATGCASVEALAARTGASTVCGSCRPLLAELAGGTAPSAPAPGGRALLGAGAAALVLALAALAFAIPYPGSVQVAWSWDVLWREAAWKQASGFTVLGLGLAALALSLRKRIRRFSLGEFAWWRVAHAAIAAFALVALAVHTGGRMGSNLNFMLMIAFLGVVAAGVAAGGIVAFEHRLGTRAVRLRRAWNWAHLLLAWPLPVLLAMHVLKSYYF